MNYPEVDMDELEARLYGQVHHMAEYNEGATFPQVQNIQAKTFTRYFDGATPTPNLLRSTLTPNYDRMGVYSIPVAPISNIVVVQPPPTRTLTDDQPNSQKWVEQILQKYENARSKTKRKFRKLKNKIRKRKNIKAKKRNAKLTPTDIPVDSIVSTVDLYENCKEVKSDNVCVISDGNSNCSDDVIIIENKTEVIDIDCETEQHIPTSTLTDTLSLCESSTSNDFLNNTTMSKGKTSTLNTSKDIYETVSSCSSIIDYHKNLKRPQEDFSVLPSSSTLPELNLDGFTNYITSNGKRSCDLATLTWLPAAKRPKYQPKKKSSNTSDSSSESDDDNSLKDDEQLEDDDSKNVVENVNKSETGEDEIDTPVEKNDNPIIYIDDDVEMWKTPRVDNEVGHKPERFSKYWTEDMNKFYRESWGHENFSVIEQQQKMSDDPNMWKISVKDRLNANNKSWEPRCRRCLEFGHIAIKCTKILEPVKCCLCGGKGHTEARCPDAVCTTCRRKSPYYTTFCGGCVRKRQVICPICNMTGHKDSDCPDLWRRYLFTTKDGEVQEPTGAANMKLLEDRWCSGCGKNGHFEQNCHYYNRSHAATSVFIHSFQNVYGTNDLPPDCENVSSTENFSDNLNEQQTETTEHTTENTDELNPVDVWPIGQAKYNHLVGDEAGTFLRLLQSKTSVTIQVKPTGKVRLLFSGGTAEDRSNTKAAISRYLAAKEILKIPTNILMPLDIKKPKIKGLKHNLNWLNNEKTDWLGMAHLIYKRIQMLTDLIAHCTQPKTYRKHQRTLKEFYQKLNTIIIGKLKIGSDKTHMDTLEKCLENNQILLYSFEYVFNSGHVLYPNYEELIAQLPHVPNKLAHDMQSIVFEIMKSSMINVCRKWNLRAWLKRIVHLYNDLVISNYSKRQTHMFKSTCSKISEVVETLRKKNVA